MQEENLRQNIPSQLPDQEAMASGCVSKLTRTNSGSSAITADSSRNSSLHNDYSAPFMVLQDGPWQKINPKRNKPSLESTADFYFVQENPCLHHFTSSFKRCSVACHVEEHSVASSERLHIGENSPFCSARSSEQHSSSRLYHNSSVGIAIEVSDQNFVDVRQGEKSNCRAMAKRLKKVVTDASSSDQVVPSGNPGMDNASTASRASSIREEQVNQELRSENLNNFVYPKSEDHYYSRES